MREGLKHTPKPWAITAPAFPGRRRIYRANVSAGHAAIETIAEINEGSPHADGNALLLEAAPELLAACERVLEHCHRCDLGPIADQIEHAIAKARGTHGTHGTYAAEVPS